MPAIELKKVEKNICQNINLHIHDRELMVLVGPTGGGKTTLLNVISGITQYNGSVMLDGDVVDDLAPDKRRIGYLFQDLALFPHLDVAANVAYGLKIQKVNSAIRKARVHELLEMLKITHLKHRYPKGLSGGERQRVALARALAPSPEILLLDEPMSSLDPTTSKYLRIELKKIIKKQEITAVYVTHDLIEAEEMGDRITLISNGNIQQTSTPRDMIFSPSNATVSHFVGMPNIIECDSSRLLDHGLVEIQSGDMRMLLPYNGKKIKKIAIFPSDVYISATPPPSYGMNHYKCTVCNIEYLSSVARVKILVKGNIMLSELPIVAFEQLGLQNGQEAFVFIKMRRLRYAETNN
jgi:ABC-type Fe3+/spermidine/putrescine transport system ATPase subunit